MVNAFPCSIWWATSMLVSPKGRKHEWDYIQANRSCSLSVQRTHRDTYTACRCWWYQWDSRNIPGICWRPKRHRRFFSPDSGDHCIGATDNGETYLKLSELRDYQNQGLSLNEVIERLDEYDGDVPPFELSEEPLDLPESISNSYEWTCPDCAALNVEKEIPPTITCSKCQKKFIAAEFFKSHEYE